jgi:hypothetical protein
MQLTQQAMQPQQPNSLANTLDQVLNVLAQRFGTPVAHLWKVLVQYQYVHGISEIVLSGLFAVITAACFTISIKNWRQEDCWDYPNKAIPAILGAIIGAVLVGVVASNLYDGIQYLLAPEYFALQDILAPLKAATR